MVGNLARSRADVANDTIVPAYLCTPAVVLFRYCLVDPHGNSPRRGPVNNFRSAELTTFAHWQHVEGVSSPPAASAGERGPFLATGTHTFSSFTNSLCRPAANWSCAEFGHAVSCSNVPTFLRQEACNLTRVRRRGAVKMSCRNPASTVSCRLPGWPFARIARVSRLSPCSQLGDDVFVDQCVYFL